MSELNDNPRAPGHSGKSIAVSSAIAAVVASLILVLFVMPAEYGIDPTGVGDALGLKQMNAPATATAAAPAQPTKKLEFVDVIGGNEVLNEVEIPDYGEPVPLPNPEVFQDGDEPPRTDTIRLTLKPEGETEVKAVLEARKVMVYTWKTEGGPLYSDFHGHDPEAGDELWVRYKENQEPVDGDSGSLVAPISGEHGWYWVNVNDVPVTVTLTVTGFQTELIDYSPLF